MPQPEEQRAAAEQILEAHRKCGRCDGCDGGGCWMHWWAQNAVAAAAELAEKPKPVHWRYDGPTPSGASPWESRSG